MAPPAAKRRKLSHSDSSEDEEPEFSDDVNGANAFEDVNDVDNNGSDASVHDDLMPIDDSDMDVYDDDSEAEEESLSNTNNNTRAEHIKEEKSNMKGEKGTKKRRNVIPQDGVYTAEVYKSNMFKLQVDELLEQVSLKYGKKEAPAENAMRTLKNIIEQIPGREPLSIVDAEKTLKAQKIVIPFPYPPPAKDAKYKLQYDRPSNINATGSYPLKVATRAGDELAIDLVVTMPTSILQEKDYLNHRYLYKRAYYLASIAAGIRSSKDHKFKLSFDCLNGNHLQPIIVVRASGDGGSDDFATSKSKIHIIPAIPDKFFPTSKLLPNANCIRPKGSDEGSSTKSLNPTPFYNATVQADSSVTAYLKLLHASSSQCDAYKDACILGRVWLRQRGFGSGIRKGGFGNFEWAAIMALLLQKNPGAGMSPLSAGYSSYQLFKATLQFLANRDLYNQPYMFQANNVTIPKHEAGPVFFDGPRNLNILFKMTPWSYALLQDEARISVKTLGDSTFDQFESTFILKANSPLFRYDVVLEIPITTLCVNTTNEGVEETIFRTCRKLHTALKRALTDRIASLSIQLPDRKSWPIGTKSPTEGLEGHILVSFVADPENANRTVDHGPAAENKKEAASFRQFWGEKAELRRFKDGSILESVVWPLKDSTMPILEQIILYIVRRHISTEVADKARFAGDSFARLIQSGRVSGQSGTTVFQPLMSAFASLEKEIRDLEGLPLQVRQILVADPQLRYSSIEPPFPVTQQLMSRPASIIIQFEGSGRWPDDLSAIQRTKIAFLLKLSELLDETNPKLNTHVGLENPAQASQNQAYLDIIESSGASFRLRIHHDREATLLDRQLKDKSLDGPSRESAALALAVYKRDFIRIPTHTQTIQSLCTRFPSLSPSIRLTKKWFASHLLTPHIAPELIELLVVRTFLQPYPWPVPGSATTGFLRTLFWISRWDWRHVPLIVDFAAANPEQGTMMKSEEVSAITTRFEAWRRIDPAMNRVVLFAASNLDTEGTTWTDKGRPERVVAGRMTALARAAVGVLKEEEARLSNIVNGNATDAGNIDAFNPSTLFTSSLTDYDFLLHLSPKFTKAGKARKDAESAFKNLQLQNSRNRDPRLVGYDPVALFFEELKAVYGNAVLWFWDSEGGDAIAGLWNPAGTARRAWKVRIGYSSVPVRGSETKKKGSGDVDVDGELNREGILSEIARLGGEMVDRVEVVEKA